MIYRIFSLKRSTGDYESQNGSLYGIYISNTKKFKNSNIVDKHSNTCVYYTKLKAFRSKTTKLNGQETVQFLP